MFEMPHHVVTQVADSATEKTWQPLDFDRREAGQNITNAHQRIAGGVAGKNSVFNDFDCVSPGTDNNRRAGSQKAVARPFFTALDTFQQKGKTTVIQLLESGYRCVHI